MKKMVRILDLPEDHVNAYGWAELIDENKDVVFVTNMNMPFQGTLAFDPIPLNKVEFRDGF